MYGLVVGIGWQFVVVSLLISRLKLQHLENNINKSLCSQLIHIQNVVPFGSLFLCIKNNSYETVPV